MDSFADFLAPAAGVLVTFSDVAGIDEAKGEPEEVFQFLQKFSEEVRAQAGTAGEQAPAGT